jgi:hypothetical protein
VSGIATFGSDVNSAGSLKSSIAPTTAPHSDTSGMPVITVANGSSAQIADAANQYILFISEGTAIGAIAIYALRGVNNVAVLLSSGSAAFVASTTTPSAGQMSVAWGGSNFRVYNNVGGVTTFKCHLMRIG